MVRKSARTKGATAPFPLSELKSLLHYDEATGIFTWLVDQKRRQVKSGDIAGTLQKNGYIEIGLMNQRHYAHRLAWYYVTGEWPRLIDHKGVRLEKGNYPTLSAFFAQMATD